METKNRINVYVCEKCGADTVTVDRDEGVTPFMLKCRANNIGCGGWAQSSMYQVRQDLVPFWEWYKPAESELQSLDTETAAHVRDGGLLLRKLDAAGREAYGQRLRRG